ncbi:hypothetical protein BN12_4060004 [Nostocoides japonicum T1-X7]|uniref:Uncharacterized protein n=1 Tax=Nostocoides japonicum T1-X7 TaxID=1194083 RepID=A0A077M504_9MICO|nr:hypothetical protein BN12_4060004 [Tetrasphaera japonica T1-X7]
MRKHAVNGHQANLSKVRHPIHHYHRCYRRLASPPADSLPARPGSIRTATPSGTSCLEY